MLAVQNTHTMTSLLTGPLLHKEHDECVTRTDFSVCFNV